MHWLAVHLLAHNVSDLIFFARVAHHVLVAVSNSGQSSTTRVRTFMCRDVVALHLIVWTQAGFPVSWLSLLSLTVKVTLKNAGIEK